MSAAGRMSERPAAIRQARERSIVRTVGPYLLDIDFGTGGARVGIFDPGGTPLVFSEREYTLEHPRPGWAEQDPDEWWSSLVAAVGSAVGESSISPEDIAGISVDAMRSTVLALDENDRHLRPAIMWMDVRSSEQADRIAGTNDNALKYNGYGAVSAEWGLPKALWIKENEPGVYKQARHICDCGDWLIQRLTGEWKSSINMASSKYYYDRDEGGYPESLYDAVDAGDLLDKFPNEVLDLGTVAGGLRKEAAEALDLKAGTPLLSCVDFVGVEVCAAAKNCYALGAGFMEGILDREGQSEARYRNYDYGAALFGQATRELRRFMELLGGEPETPYGLAGVGDMFVTSMGGRNVKVGRLVGSGLRFSEARERMPGVTLEGAAAIKVIGDALPKLTERGVIAPEDFPLMRHLHAVIAEDEPLDMPWSAFFGGEPQKSRSKKG